MPKAFLSHSSKDKKGYVEIVARQIGFQNCIYDDLTFEEGMKSIEEIEKGLGKADLFVLFLSDAALESKWVKTELKDANKLLDEKLLSRIYPIIVDPNINHKDRRIPQWLRKEYNLKYISRPTIATRRIRQRLREISWDFHPRLKEKRRIFFGRNNLIKEFEERTASLDLPTPVCIIASGINKIGRKVLLSHCLKKTNNIDDSYEPPLIKLNSHESLEDFILKVYDLGFSEPMDVTNFINKPIEEKEKIATLLVQDLQKAREVLFINDDGCIVTPESKLSNWFENILRSFAGCDRITFCVASSFRTFYPNIRNIENLLTLRVPELDKSERTGLLKRYSDFEKLNLLNEDLKFLANLLTGFPEQVFYAVQLVKELGINKTKDNSYLIADFNYERVTFLLSKYEEDERAMNFLHLLSSFDFISYDFVFEIVGTEEIYRRLLDEFLAKAICEQLGANKEYIRVNDGIRDYVLRTKHEIDSKYKKRLKKHLAEFLQTYESEEKDASDFFFSMKEALLLGEEINEKYLIPSHFLSTMKELYDQYKRYDDVVKLADRVLQQEAYMDEFIKFQIRYYLCSALAKLRDRRFTQEVMKIHGAEHNFLFGFYYRMLGRNLHAIERLLQALEERPQFPRARRELVQAYLNIEGYQEALELAKLNYRSGKNNPYHIQAYFTCLSRSDPDREHESTILELLQNLERINSEKAREMFLESKALYCAVYKEDEHNALKLIEEAIHQFPNSPYSRLAKFEICERFDRTDKMKETIEGLDNLINPKSPHYNSFLIRKAYYYAYEGDIVESFETLSRLRDCPRKLYEKARRKIELIANDFDS